MIILLPVIHQSILGFSSLQSLHIKNEYHESAIGWTNVPVLRYCMNCIVDQLNDQLLFVVYWIVYVLIVNCAVYVLFHVTHQSLLVSHVTPSIHQLNVYPVLAIACTDVPVFKYGTL